MSIVWTPAGKGESPQFVIRDCTCNCETCEGTGFVGEKRRVWSRCPGFNDKGENSCPNEELQEEGPITAFFEIEGGGGGGFEACPQSGVKRLRPASKGRTPALIAAVQEGSTRGKPRSLNCSEFLLQARHFWQLPQVARRLKAHALVLL